MAHIDDPKGELLACRKLHHKFLFKECINHAVAAWKLGHISAQDPIMQHKGLQVLARLKHGELQASLAKVLYRILSNVMSESIKLDDIDSYVLIKDCLLQGGSWSQNSPIFFRVIYKEMKDHRWRRYI